MSTAEKDCEQWVMTEGSIRSLARGAEATGSKVGKKRKARAEDCGLAATNE